jgi:hypothetical protein
VGAPWLDEASVKDLAVVDGHPQWWDETRVDRLATRRVFATDSRATLS